MFDDANRSPSASHLTALPAPATSRSRSGRRARPLELATRLAVVAVVAGPSLLCAALVATSNSHGTSPLLQVHVAPCATTQPDALACEDRVADAPAAAPAAPAR